MRSIERRFLNLQHKQPVLSSLLNFTGAIRGQIFTKDALSRWFNVLVEKDDYAPADKRAIVGHLVALSWSKENRKNSS